MSNFQNFITKELLTRISGVSTVKMKQNTGSVEKYYLKFVIKNGSWGRGNKRRPVCGHCPYPCPSLLWKSNDWRQESRFAPHASHSS